MNKTDFFLVFALLACGLMLYGCTNFGGSDANNGQGNQGPAPNGNGQHFRNGSGGPRNGTYGGGPGGFGGGNFSKIAEDACAGKAEGEACEMQMPSRNQTQENFTVSGTCQTRSYNGTSVLSCAFQRPGQTPGTQ